jgi:hypothetical protein
MVEKNRLRGPNNHRVGERVPNTESNANFRRAPVVVGAKVTLTWHEGAAGVSNVPVQPSDTTEKSELRLRWTNSRPDH